MPDNFSLILEATWDTLIMVFFSGMLSLLIGVPLGIVIYLTRKGQFLEHKWLYRILSIIVNIGRSVPFIILMVAIIPITRLIAGTSIGTAASIVPLTISAIPFVARIAEGAIAKVPAGLVEAAQAMGARPLQIIWKVLLPEAFPGLIHGATLTVITLIGYTAMAGTIGGGGLGSVAINYGYQRFDVSIMLITVCILVALVQIIQWLGDYLQAYYARGRD